MCILEIDMYYMQIHSFLSGYEGNQNIAINQLEIIKIYIIQVSNKMHIHLNLLKKPIVYKNTTNKETWLLMIDILIPTTILAKSNQLVNKQEYRQFISSAK